jgi:SAM-dependent methyltransferase
MADYWNQFYKQFNIDYPSDFCSFILNYIKEPKNILDCGCGNGRDSYELSKYHNVLGVDLGTLPKEKDNCAFSNENFVTLDKTPYNLIYSRFTFHSITNEDHEVFLDSIKVGSILCIETRSDKSINDVRIHGDSHYRNFTNINYIKELVSKKGFTIMYIEEKDDVAIYKSENPICIRLIAIKTR